MCGSPYEPSIRLIPDFVTDNNGELVLDLIPPADPPARLSPLAAAKNLVNLEERGLLM
jgi:hypothetical protein